MSTGESLLGKRVWCDAGLMGLCTYDAVGGVTISKNGDEEVHVFDRANVVPASLTPSRLPAGTRVRWWMRDGIKFGKVVSLTAGPDVGVLSDTGDLVLVHISLLDLVGPQTLLEDSDDGIDYARPKYITQGTASGMCCHVCGVWYEYASEQSPGYQQALGTIVCAGCR